MNHRHFIFACCLLLVSAVSAQAQWSGSVDASGGAGVMKSLRGQLWDEIEGIDKFLWHGLGKGAATIQYQDSLFKWTSRIDGSYEPNNMDYLNADYMYDSVVDDVLKYDGLVRMSEKENIRAQYRTDAEWGSRPDRKVSLWLSYAYASNEGANVTAKFNKEGVTDFYGDEQRAWNHDINTGVQFTRRLSNPRHSLSAKFEYHHSVVDQRNEWVTTHWKDVGSEVWADRYKVTPHNVTDDVSGVFFFSDTIRKGKVQFLINPGIRMAGMRALHENSGATAIDRTLEEDAVWRDSTELREHFLFRSLDIQPFLIFSLKGKKVTLHADFAPMYYARRLEDSTHHQGLKFQRPYLVGNGKFTWQMAEGHAFSLNYFQTVRHPNYQQVCWFDRTGGYLDRLYRGNPDLKSNVTRSLKGDYKWTHKRFIASFAVSYSRSLNEIVQTWFKEEIDDRTYNVFTWVNGADSREFGLSPSVGWRGQVLTANLGMDFNRSYQALKEKEELKKSNAWSLSADVALKLGKGWRISADARYQSAVTRFFSIFDDYCIVNARVQKNIKNVTLFLEGRHLADKTMTNRIESAEENHIWTELNLLNRRLILLGCRWSF